MSVVEIINAGSMSARLAAMFWIGMERGASIIVAADPPSAGKTTTLSALLAFTPPDTLVYFTRGQGETFSLPPLTDSVPTYLLINEMSDHIPVYTWDDHARRAFELLAEGYSMATTMHADTLEGVLQQLEGDLSIPRSQIAKLTFVVPLYIGGTQGPIRRVARVHFLQPSGNGVAAGDLASWERDGDTFTLLSDPAQRAAFAHWAGLSEQELDAELDRREGFLRQLQSKGVESVREVSLAIEGFYDEVLKTR
jgi:hypothetical protein